MLWKRMAVLVAAAVMVLSMLAVSVPAFAQGVGGSDPNPGGSEGSSARHETPPQGKPGTRQRADEGNEHDPSDPSTGFGQRVDEQQG